MDRRSLRQIASLHLEDGENLWRCWAADGGNGVMLSADGGFAMHVASARTDPGKLIELLTRLV
jgi:hypothetical protein